MAKKFVRTVKSIWDKKLDKSEYNDSIVFVEDTNQIWSNGVYYKGADGEKGDQGDKGENGKDGTFVHSYNEATKTLSFNSSLTNINLDLNSY